MTEEKVKQASKAAVTAFILTIIVLVGIISWKLLSTFQCVIVTTTLFIICLVLMFHPRFTLDRAASTIIRYIDALVKRSHVRPYYVVAVVVVVIGLWLHYSVLVDGRIIVIGLCLGGIILVYYIKPYNSNLATTETDDQIKVLLAAWGGITVFIIVMFIATGIVDWEVIIYTIFILSLIFCGTLFLVVFILSCV